MKRNWDPLESGNGEVSVGKPQIRLGDRWQYSDTIQNTHGRLKAVSGENRN